MNNSNENNFVKAVKYIYANMDQPIRLTDIASEIGISETSLKRLFEEATNQSPGAFIRRMRMEMAFRSIKNRDESILEIALSSGFEDPSAFARCFKRMFGYSPRVARTKLNIINELESITLEEPDIIEISNLTIQSITEVGLYFESAPRAWRKLKDSFHKNELTDDFSGVFIGIGHDNPHEGNIKEHEVRYTAGVALLDRNLHLNAMKIADGRYARFRYKGKPNNMGIAYHYIYGKWNEASSSKINKAIPAFVIFERLPESLKEEDVLIHVPLSKQPQSP